MTTLDDRPELPAPDGMSSSREVCRRTRLTYRELLFAVDRGWLNPSNGTAVGSGQRYLFDDHAVRVATVFACLRRAGIAAGVAAPLANRVVDPVPGDTLHAIAPGIAVVVDERHLEPADAPRRYDR